MTSRILPVILILASLGIFFGYVNPTYTTTVKALQQEIKSYDAALVAAQDYAEKEAQLIAERNSIPAEGIARLEAFLPDGVDNVQLILDLNSLAARSGLVLSDFDISVMEENNRDEGDQLALASETGIESLQLSMSGSGSYESFKRFLEGTEWSLRPLDLVSLELQDSATGIYNYDMTFRIYWLANP